MADAVVEGRKGVLDPIERWSEIIFGLLIALAGLVLYQPVVLVHLAAALFAVIGGFCIVFAWRVRRIGRARTYHYWSASWWADAL